MGCGYMGCATFLNKMAWTVFAVLLGLAAVLLGIGLARAAPCTKTLTNCTRNNPGYVRDKNVCNLPFRACARSHLIVAGVGVIALILGVCTLCFMCCCSKPPPPKVRKDGAVVWLQLHALCSQQACSRTACSTVKHTLQA